MSESMASSWLPPPVPGGAYHPAWFVGRDAACRQAYKNLSMPYRPAVLWLPRRAGKTWLLTHLCDAIAREERWRVITVDFARIPSEQSATTDPFLRAFAAQIAQSAQLPEATVEQIWSGFGDAGSKLTWLLQRDVLEPATAPVVLAIDNADAIWASRPRNDVYPLLRSWVEETRAPWDKLRLVLTVAIPPGRITVDATVVNPDLDPTYVSPFNIVTEIVPDELTVSDAGQLVERYGLRADEQELAALTELVGGQPYLLQLALFHAQQEGLPLAGFLEAGHGSGASLAQLAQKLLGWEPGGSGDRAKMVFDSHLRECEAYLRQNVALWNSFCDIVHARSQPVENSVFTRLYAAGLVVASAPQSAGSGGHYGIDAHACRPRCPLYARYFHKRCGTMPSLQQTQ